MSYVYDILLNYNYIFYDFYDWNENDNFTHIKKIPIFKTTTNVLKDILYNDIKIDTEFIKKIHLCTEIYQKYRVKKIPYSVLLCDSKKVIGIKCDSEGHVISRSDLLIDEFYDVVSLSDRYTYYDIKYAILKPLNKNDFITRNGYIKKEIY